MLTLRTITAVALATTLLLPALAAASDPGAAEAETESVSVALGGSAFLPVRGSVASATLTDPAVADVQSAGGGLLVIGRRIGETNLILAGGRSSRTVLIKVAMPARAVLDELRRLFPREDIAVRGVGGTLVLSGSVGSVSSVEAAEKVALGYLSSPSFDALGLKPQVINLLSVRGRQQVQLEVKFAEVSRRSLRQVGVNAVGGHSGGLFGAATGRASASAIGGKSVANMAGSMHTATAAGDSIGALFLNIADGKFPFAATLNLLATRDLSKTLAEPRLVALSGQTARFLAGGEFPYEKSNGFTTSVEFKEFGIDLGFTPTVLDDGTIQLKTSTSVSAPDPTLTIVVNNKATGGFKRRSSETTVRLRDGQSFAIAGLLSDEMENLVSKVPGLGDLPILGSLFSSKSFQRRQTELIVVVTARLVDPMRADDMPALPGEDRVSDPTDLQLFLLNQVEPSSSAQGFPQAGKSREVSGAVGFIR